MPTTPTLESHDVLLTSGATTIGINITKDEKGIPIFTRKSLPGLSDQQYQTLGEQAFIPQLEQPFSQAEWHAGFGKQLYTSKRYLKTTNTDASLKGMVIPSPVKVAMTNSNPTQTGYNMGFESWTTISSQNYLDNWAHDYNASLEPSYVKDTTVYQGGAASLRRGAQDFIIWQGLGVTVNNGSIITVTIYGRAITSNASITVKVYNGDTSLATVISGSATAGAGWTQLSGNYTFTSTISNPTLWIEVVSNGPTTDGAWIDTVAVSWSGTALTTLTPATIVKALDFNSNHYFVSDTGVWKRSAADLVWVGGSPSGITDAFISGSTATGSSYLVLCRGNSILPWFMRTNEGFQRSIGGATCKIKHGASIGAIDYGDSGAAALEKFTTGLPTASASSTTYTLGAASYAVTSVLDHLGFASVTKEGYAAYVNAAGTVIEIAKELRSLFNTNTGQNAISWHGKNDQTLYIPAGAGASLWDYDEGVDIGPNMFAERLSDFKGQVVATISDDEWLYAVLDNGTKIEILKGRYETIDGTTDFRWHSTIEDTYTTVVYAHVSSITAKRLYYGGGTALPKYIPLAVASGDPLTDTTLSFQTGSTFETSWYDMGLKNVLKNFRSVGLRSASLSGTARTLKIEYDIDDGNGYVELGGTGSGTFNTSPYQEKFFADGIEARYIKFRVTFTTNDSTVGLGLLSLTVNYILNPTSLDMWEFPFTIDEHSVIRKTGDADIEQPYSVIQVQLQAWKNTIPLTFTFPDGLFTASDGSHDGTTKKVRIAPQGLVERPITFARNGPNRIDQTASFTLTLWEVRTS